MTSISATQTLLDALKEISKHGYGMQSIIETYSDTNAFNFHAMRYYQQLSATDKSIAAKAVATYEKQVGEQLDDAALFDFLKNEGMDLRCFNVPTGGDDFTVDWKVVEHDEHGNETVVARAYCDDPKEAIRQAIIARELCSTAPVCCA
jgi:hypothetical protein